MWREVNMKSNSFWTTVSEALAVVAVTLIVALIMAPGASAAVTYKVLHQFNGTDGADPYDASGLIFDASAICTAPLPEAVHTDMALFSN
jgi:hypothetical protein